MVCGAEARLRGSHTQSAYCLAQHLEIMFNPSHFTLPAVAPGGAFGLLPKRLTPGGSAVGDLYVNKTQRSAQDTRPLLDTARIVGFFSSLHPPFLVYLLKEVSVVGQKH